MPICPTWTRAEIGSIKIELVSPPPARPLQPSRNRRTACWVRPRTQLPLHIPTTVLRVPLGTRGPSSVVVLARMRTSGSDGGPSSPAASNDERRRVRTWRASVAGADVTNRRTVEDPGWCRRVGVHVPSHEMHSRGRGRGAAAASVRLKAARSFSNLGVARQGARSLFEVRNPRAGRDRSGRSPRPAGSA